MRSCLPTRFHGLRVVRCTATVLSLSGAASCGGNATAPTSPVWVNHATVTGRVFLPGPVTVPSARVTLASVGRDDSLAQYAADSAVTDATGRFTITIKRDAGASKHFSPPLYIAVGLIAKDPVGTVIAESAAVSTKFGPIGDPAPVTPNNIVAR